MDNSQTYAEAINELESISQEMEDSEIDVDQLASKAKRAAELIKFCKERLSHAETEVGAVLKELKGETENKTGTKEAPAGDDLPF